MFAYKERICLVQISTRSRDYIIDPLAVDLAPLGVVLADPGIVKVLHGAEFDILLLKRELGIEFAGLFDTRVAAASLGFEAPGLASVLDEWLGETLDKRFQRSDWGKRPLSEGQLDYARSDTCFLLELAESMRADLREQGSPHVEEVAAECRRLEGLEPDVRRLGLTELVKVKGAGSLDGDERRALVEINALRHRLAEARDAPLFKIFGNDVVLELARRRPANRRELESSKVLPPKLLSRYGSDVLGALDAARKAGPLRSQDLPSCASEEDALGPSEAARYESLRQWRRDAALERGVEANLVLSRAQMLALVRCSREIGGLDDLLDAGLLEGWRARYYGEGIVAALASHRGGRRGDRRNR